MSKKIAPAMPFLGAVPFLLGICLGDSDYLKRSTMLLLAAGLAAVFLCYSKLRGQVRLPAVMLGLMLVMDGISCFYAVSGKFALYELMKLVMALCLALLLAAFCKEGGRSAATVLASASALSGLVSIDMLSTHFISGPVLAFLAQIGENFANLSGVEPGTRMTSMFTYPNIFAGFTGIGVLLSLGLVSTAEGRERIVQLVGLFINSLAFVLAFSMGGTGAIAAAFLAYLLLAYPGQRIRMLLMMVETLVVTLLAAFPISITSFSEWNGVQPIPLLCVVLGAALLCAADHFAARRLSGLLEKHQRLIVMAAAGIAAVLAVYLIAAFNLTGGTDLQPGETLRRGSHPGPGEYAMTAEADGAVQVAVVSQNREDTMMHTSTTLYEGALSTAVFTVPEDSQIVYFDFTAGEEAVRLESAGYENGETSASLPLKYLLLPGFIANRLQSGVFANQNAVQRLVFFEDGMKIFMRHPVLGSGLGSFENGLRSVQSFYYSTRYAHNHYVQTLSDTGIVGFLLFIGLLAVCGAAVWFGRRGGAALAPVLGAVLVFMAAHAFVEMVFSTYTYLPMAFGVFLIINDCCGDAIPLPARFRGQRNQAAVLLSGTALLAVFAVLLYGNASAQSKTQGGADFEVYEAAVKMDRFEWADHALNYVIKSIDEPDAVDEEIRGKADRYAEKLEKLNSNTVPLYLAEYYLETGRTAKGMEMAQKYVSYMAASSTAWNKLLAMLVRYEQDTPDYKEGTAALANFRQEWEADNLGTIELEPQHEDLLSRMQEAAAEL